MDIYIARQPIFDRSLKLYGYELLFRHSKVNQFDGRDDLEATIALLSNSFLVFDFEDIIDGTLGFMNFPASLLVSEYMYLLPKMHVVVEILERVEVNEEVIAACRQLKANGYRIALDDFVLAENHLRYQPILDLVDIIKVEFPQADHDAIAKMIDKYPHIQFLAEKVETFKEYYTAKELGFQMFQGFFFARPNMNHGKEIGVLSANLLKLIEEIDQEEPSFEKLETIITSDVGLSYKLLKMANYVAFGARQRVNSIRQALLQIGLWEIKRWAYLMLLRDIRRADNEVLINQSALRGRMLSLIAKTQSAANEFDWFLAGIFSSLDILLNDSMEHAISRLSLSSDVKDALLGRDNVIRRHLEIVIAYEQAHWQKCEEYLKQSNLTMNQLTEFYVASIQWQQNLRKTE